MWKRVNLFSFRGFWLGFIYTVQVALKQELNALPLYDDEQDEGSIRAWNHTHVHLLKWHALRGEKEESEEGNTNQLKEAHLREFKGEPFIEEVKSDLMSDGGWKKEVTRVWTETGRL